MTSAATLPTSGQSCGTLHTASQPRASARMTERDFTSCEYECALDAGVASTHVDVSDTCYGAVSSTNCCCAHYQFVLVALHPLLRDSLEGVNAVFCGPNERHRRDQLQFRYQLLDDVDTAANQLLSVRLGAKTYAATNASSIQRWTVAESVHIPCPERWPG